jgi:ABC-type multidrug transport system fused ATPase/permease subunit
MAEKENKTRLRIPPIQVPVFVFRRLWPRIYPHRWALTAATFFLLASASIGLAFPLFVRHLMDAAFVSMDRALLNRIALFLLGLFGIQAAFRFCQVYLLGATGERVIAGIRKDLFEHLLTLSPDFFTERTTGELTSRLTSDVVRLQSVLGYQISELLRQTLYLFGSLTMLTLMHRQLTFTTLAVAPAVVFIAFVFGRRLRRASTKVQDEIAAANTVAEESIVQIRTVQSFVREAWEARRYGEGIDAALKAALGRALDRRGAQSGVRSSAHPRRLLRRDHAGGVRWHRRRALAGRPPGAGRRDHRRPAGVVPAVRRDGGGGDLLTGVAVGRLPGGAGRGGARVRTIGSTSDGGGAGTPDGVARGRVPYPGRCLVPLRR